MKIVYQREFESKLLLPGDTLKLRIEGTGASEDLAEADAIRRMRELLIRCAREIELDLEIEADRRRFQMPVPNVYRDRDAAVLRAPIICEHCGLEARESVFIDGKRLCLACAPVRP